MSSMSLVCLAALWLSGFLAPGRSAPVNECENLLRRLENLTTDTILGKWIFIAESSTLPGTKEMRGLVSSVWYRISQGSEHNNVSVSQFQKMFGQCYTLNMDMTFENDTLSAVTPLPLTDVFMTTSCADCLLIHKTVIIGGKPFTSLVLMSKRRSVSSTEFSEYEKQVDCLNLPSPLVLDINKALCLDNQGGNGTDLTRFLHGELGRTTTRMLEQFVNRESALEEFLKIFNINSQ